MRKAGHMHVSRMGTVLKVWRTTMHNFLAPRILLKEENDELPGRGLRGWEGSHSETSYYAHEGEAVTEFV